MFLVRVFLLEAALAPLEWDTALAVVSHFGRDLLLYPYCVADSYLNYNPPPSYSLRFLLPLIFFVAPV